MTRSQAFNSAAICSRRIRWRFIADLALIPWLR
jgi:hypothetical protein